MTAPAPPDDPARRSRQGPRQERTPTASCSTASTSPPRPAASSRSSARTAPASPRCSGCWPGRAADGGTVSGPTTSGYLGQELDVAGRDRRRTCSTPRSRPLHEAVARLEVLAGRLEDPASRRGVRRAAGLGRPPRRLGRRPAGRGGGGPARARRRCRADRRWLAVGRSAGPARAGRPAHPPAGVPAARRADQPPRRRGDGLPRGDAARAARGRGGRQPRPGLPRRGRRPRCSTWTRTAAVDGARRHGTVTSRRLHRLPRRARPPSAAGGRPPSPSSRRRRTGSARTAATTARQVAHDRPPRDNDKFIYHVKGANVAAHRQPPGPRRRAAAGVLERDLVPKPPRPLRFDGDAGPRRCGGSVHVRELVVPGGCSVDRLDVGRASGCWSPGRNGSGKSTLLKVLAGRLTRRARDGREVAGAQPGLPAAGGRGSATRARRRPRSYAASAAAGPAPRARAPPPARAADRPVGELSLGQQRRLALALLVARRPTWCCSTSRRTTSPSRSPRSSRRPCSARSGRSSSPATTGGCGAAGPAASWRCERVSPCAC